MPTDKEQVNIDELLSKFNEQDSSLKQEPTELSPNQKVTRFMAVLLMGVVVLLVFISVFLWDGKNDGVYSDLWEYTKLIGTTIIGGVVATYLQPSNND